MSSFLGFCEGDTRNRWRDGQVCPDVDKELWRSGVFWRWTCVPDVDKELWGVFWRERGRHPKGDVGRGGQESPGERTDGRRRRKKSRRRKKRVGERESEARLEWRKGLSPEIGVKKTMNAGGVEYGNMN
ncbi:hypothetical protein TNCV_3861591 [Trichonephila clavipes]|nr:hypothetical protein TNCV_3861591 [Trichonephila clavipes]